MSSLANDNRELHWKLCAIIEALMKALPPEKRQGGFTLEIDQWRLERMMMDGPGGLPIRFIVNENRLSMQQVIRVFLVNEFEQWTAEQKKREQSATPKRFFELES